MELDIDDFLAIYPQFVDVPTASLQFAWKNALMISGLANDSSYTADEKENLLFMLLCHLLTLAQRGTAGAMTSATEGSVSVGFSAPQYGKESDWYMTTPCGSAYWQIVKGHRYGGAWFDGCKC